MITDIENGINFVPLFEIACFKEYDEMFIDGITLKTIGRLIGIEWVYKANHKANGEVDDFIVKEKYVIDILKGCIIGKAKSIMINFEEKMKLTKDCASDFVDATYFRKLMRA